MDKAHQKRTVTMLFRGLSLDHTVVAWRDEINVKVACAVKAACSGSHHLDPFPFEEVFFGESAATHEPDKSLVEGMQRARSHLSELLRGSEDASLILQTMERKLKWLCEIDGSFCVDYLCVKQIVKGAGQDKLQRQLLELLPTPNYAQSLSQVLASLQRLRESRLYKGLPHGAKVCADTAWTIVAEMEMGFSNREACKALSAPGGWLQNFVMGFSSKMSQ